MKDQWPRSGPVGSLLANLLRLRPAERRVLMAAGMGSGIGDTFRAPLAGTMFAAEVLYSSPEFEPEVIIPTGIASVVSYCIFGVYRAGSRCLTFPISRSPIPWLCAVSAPGPIYGHPGLLYTRSFYGFKRLFDRLPIQRHFRPAIGARSDRIGRLAVVCLGQHFLSGRPDKTRSTTASVGRPRVRLFGDSGCNHPGHERRGLDPDDDCLGQDRYHRPDHRQRRLRRRVRSFDGDRRVRRRLRVLSTISGRGWFPIRQVS